MRALSLLAALALALLASAANAEADPLDVPPLHCTDTADPTSCRVHAQDLECERLSPRPSACDPVVTCEVCPPVEIEADCETADACGVTVCGLPYVCHTQLACPPLDAGYCKTLGDHKP